MSSDLDTIVEIVEQEAGLTGTIKKAISKASTFLSRHYQELVVGIYMPLTTWVTYHFETLNKGEASLPEHIGKSLVYSSLTYLAMKSAKHEKQLSESYSNSATVDQKILDSLGGISVCVWLAYNIKNAGLINERITSAQTGSMLEFWHEMAAYFSSTVALLSFPVYSLMRAVGGIAQNYLRKERRTANLTLLAASVQSMAGKYDPAIELCNRVEEILPEYAEPNVIKAACLEKNGDHKTAFVELRKAREKREYCKLSQRTMKSDLYTEQLWTRIEAWFKMRKLRPVRKSTGKIDIDADESSSTEIIGIDITGIAIQMANVAYMFAARGLYGQALNVFREAVQFFPENLELKVLYAEELAKYADAGDEQAKHTEAAIHNEIYRRIKDSKSHLLVGCGETTLPVSQISAESSPLLHHTYIYKRYSAEEHRFASTNLETIVGLHKSTIEELQHMLENMKHAREDVEPVERRLALLTKLEFSTVLTSVPYEEDKKDASCAGCVCTDGVGDTNNSGAGQGEVVQIMRRGIGGTYRDAITDPSSPDEKVLFDIATAMAFIHAKMPTNGRARRPQKEYFIRRVGELCDILRIANNVKGVLYAGYVDDPLLNFDYVFNKDSHPENWILTTGFVPKLIGQRLLAIDWDEKGLVHQPVELVNLMDNFLCLEFPLKKEIAMHYFREYSFFKGRQEPTDEESSRFVLSYLDSVFYRTLELCFAWSSPYRPTMHEHRTTLLTNAIASVEMISQHHPSFYSQHRSNYLAREINLPILLKKLS